MSDELFIYGWSSIAKYLLCATRTVYYMRPLLMEYKAVDYIMAPAWNGGTIKKARGNIGRLDAFKFDMAGRSYGDLQHRWYNERRRIVTRYQWHLTKRVKAQGIDVPPEMIAHKRRKKYTRTNRYAKSAKKPLSSDARCWDTTTVYENGDGI